MELTNLTCEDVERDLLLGILPHNFLENGAMRLKLTFLFVDELTREKALWSASTVVLPSLVGKLLSNEGPLTLDEEFWQARGFKHLHKLILQEEALIYK